MKSQKKRLITVRVAVEADLPRAAQLWQERAFLLQQSDALQQFQAQPTFDWQRKAKSWLQNDKCAFFVAEVGEHVRAFMVLMIAEGPAGMQPPAVGKVLEMALDLHEPHAGLGSALLEAARTWLKARDIENLVVDVPARYPVEEAFWRAQGGRARYSQHWLTL